MEPFLKRVNNDLHAWVEVTDSNGNGITGITGTTSLVSIYSENDSAWWDGTSFAGASFTSGLNQFVEVDNSGSGGYLRYVLSGGLVAGGSGDYRGRLEFGGGALSFTAGFAATIETLQIEQAMTSGKGKLQSQSTLISNAAPNAQDTNSRVKIIQRATTGRN